MIFNTNKGNQLTLNEVLLLFNLTLNPNAIKAPIQEDKHPTTKYMDNADSPINTDAIPPIAGNKATI